MTAKLIKIRFVSTSKSFIYIYIIKLDQTMLIYLINLN